jgi:uncharacterized protein YkwD
MGDVSMIFWGLMLAAAAAAGPEREVLEQVNVHRRAAGLSELVWNAGAAEEARRHCGRVLAGLAAEPHEGFALRAARLRREEGAKQVGENVFLQENGAFRAARALEAWLASESHRRTLEGPYDQSGVGVVIRGRRACAAQIFLGR